MSDFWDGFDDFEDYDSSKPLEKKQLDLVTICNEVVMFETQLAEMKAIKSRLENAKADLKLAMEKAGIKKWETPNGYKVTLVPDTPSKLVEEEYIDTEAMRENDPDIFEKYCKVKTVTKGGRSGYVRISAPKEAR